MAALEQLVIDWDEKRDAMVSRLKRIEGQMRGLQRMVGDGEDCEKVAHQMSAARRAMDKAFFELMACAVTQEVERHQALTPALENGVNDVARILTKYG